MQRTWGLLLPELSAHNASYTNPGSLHHIIHTSVSTYDAASKIQSESKIKGNFINSDKTLSLFFNAFLCVVHKLSNSVNMFLLGFKPFLNHFFHDWWAFQKHFHHCWFLSCPDTVTELLLKCNTLQLTTTQNTHQHSSTLWIFPPTHPQALLSLVQLPPN
jgi:hypothetical protein